MSRRNKYYDRTESFEHQEEIKEKPPVKGVVSNCESLNVRYEPNIDAPVMVVIQKDHEVIINPEESTKDWYAAETETGIKGFVMTKFIKTDFNGID